MMLQEKVEMMKVKAQMVLNSFLRPYEPELMRSRNRTDDPMVFLLGFPWRSFISTQEELSHTNTVGLNEVFDPRGRLGRAVMVAVLLERYFPYTEFGFAEVLENQTAREVRRKLQQETNRLVRIKLARELIVHEDPHIIVTLGKFQQQFDPQSVLIRRSLCHPRVNVTSRVWEAITAISILGEASQLPASLQKVYKLGEALALCDFWLIRWAFLSDTERIDDRHDGYRNLFALNLNARLGYQMWREYGDREIFNHYSLEVIQILDDEMAEEVMMRR